MTTNLQKAYFAGGCFWCTQAIFSRLKGVTEVMSGYSGGTTANPSYKDVSDETTGHAETVEVTFDENIIPYKTLLDVFFTTHDPTSMNRQGNDIGEHYRSAIFTTTEKQEQQAKEYIEKLTKEHVFKKAIVTTVEPLKSFYEAESEHQHYYENNRNAPYCTIVIDPKIKKLQQHFKHLLKEE